jgi:peptidoglycan hydrolase-like protein with peptidoglycan-binding domain
LRAQQTLKDVGALAESVQICGIAGLKTKQAAELVVSAGGLASDKQAVPTDNELAHCNVDPQVIKSIGDKDVFLEKGEIISIQAALRAAGIIPMIIDGKYGDQTKKGIKSFQKKNGLKADCILGPATAKKMKLSQVASANFNPKGDCPKPSSCDVLADLTSQRLKIINGAGITIWEIPIQSGKLGKETRTVVGKLGAVEYGPNNNPERPSVDYPEAILVNPRAFGGGKQKFHGSYSFNPDAIINPKNGSAGCIRISISDSYILAGMPTGTDVVVTGAKPGTTQR